MDPLKHLIIILAFFFLVLSSSLLAAPVSSNPLDLSNVDESQRNEYITSLLEEDYINVTGVVKDAYDLKDLTSSMLYEIPVYIMEEGNYSKYGYVCQFRDSKTVIFAEDGFLSLFVKKNAVDKPAFARGRLINGKNISGLPSGILFLIDSLRLQNK